MREKNTIVVQHELQQTLSSETPVYDALDIRAIHEAALDFLILSPDGVDRTVDIFILEPVCAGKENIAESIFWRNENDQEIKDKLTQVEKITGKKITQQYLSTPMCNAEGMRRGKITHPIGEFFPVDVIASDEIMAEKLRERPEGPALRVTETGVFGYPKLPFGVKSLLEALKNSKTDPKHKVFVVYVVPTRKLQETAMEDREIIADSQSNEEAKKRLEKRKMRFDIPLENRDRITRSWGNRRAMNRVNEAGDEHLLDIQDEIRNAYSDFPKKRLTKAKLKRYPAIWQKAHIYRARYMMERLFGVPSVDLAVIPNKVLTVEKIMVWRGVGQKYAVMDMSAPDLSKTTA